MTLSNETEYLLGQIRNEVSDDPKLRSKGTLFTTKVPVSRSLESDAFETRLIKNFCRQWVRDHGVKYDPKRSYSDRAQYVRIAKGLVVKWDQSKVLDTDLLKANFDYQHFGLKSSKAAIFFLLLNMFIMLICLKVMGDINKGIEFFFSKREFLYTAAGTFAVTLLAGVYQTNKLNDQSEVLIKGEQLVIQRPYSLKFYEISELAFVETKMKWLGFEKTEVYRFKTSKNEIVELSNKLVGVETLKQRLGVSNES